MHLEAKELVILFSKWASMIRCLVKDLSDLLNFATFIALQFHLNKSGQDLTPGISVRGQTRKFYVICKNIALNCFYMPECPFR